MRLDATPSSAQAVDRSVAQPHATSNARIRHSCGQYVYTEKIGRAAPAFPTTCPHCGDPVRL